MKPSVFVGSSTENLAVAHAIQQNLEHDAEVTVWAQGVFAPTRSALESLLAAISDFDFAVFVFAPDDPVQIRDQKTQQVRDNVLFELGLFLGALGRERSFIVIPRTQGGFHLPTDLLGVTPLTYEPSRADKNLRAAVGPACQEIRQALKQFESSVFTKQAAQVAEVTCSLSEGLHDAPQLPLTVNRPKKLKIRFENETGRELDGLHVCFRTPVEMFFIPWRHKTKSKNDEYAPSFDYLWLTPEQVERLDRRSFDFIVNCRQKGDYELIVIAIAGERKFVQRLSVSAR